MVCLSFAGPPKGEVDAKTTTTPKLSKSIGSIFYNPVESVFTIHLVVVQHLFSDFQGMLFAFGKIWICEFICLPALKSCYFPVVLNSIQCAYY